MWHLGSIRKYFVDKVEIFLKNKFLFLMYDQKVVVFPVFLHNLKGGELFPSQSGGIFLRCSKTFKTYKSILKKNLQGLSRHFYEVLVLRGIGFRASVSEGKLCLELGFSHLVFLKIPKTLKVFCPTKTSIFVSGKNLQRVKEFCSLIQRQKKIDPYKGKGIFFRTKTFKPKAFKK